jgi:hypothetical protein
MTQQAKAPGLRGWRTVAEALRLEDFPMDRHSIDYAVGDVEVPDGSGTYVPVRLLTDRLERDEFRSAEETIRALQAVAHIHRRHAA